MHSYSDALMRDFTDYPIGLACTVLGAKQILSVPVKVSDSHSYSCFPGYLYLRGPHVTLR